MKTYFKKEISSFCIDDVEQSYTQINVGTNENAIIKGKDTRILEFLMELSADSDFITEIEFLSKKTEALSNLSI